MTRSSKKLLLLAATLATSLNSLTTLEAGCHGSSGRRVYSSHNYVSRPVYSQPHYPHEVISHPQPVYVHSQPEAVYDSSPYSSAPVKSSPFGVQVQQGASVGATPVSLAQQVQIVTERIPAPAFQQGLHNRTVSPEQSLSLQQLGCSKSLTATRERWSACKRPRSSTSPTRMVLLPQRLLMQRRPPNCPRCRLWAVSHHHRLRALRQLHKLRLSQPQRRLMLEPGQPACRMELEYSSP